MEAPDTLGLGPEVLDWPRKLRDHSYAEEKNGSDEVGRQARRWLVCTTG